MRCTKEGIEFRRAKVGDRYVLEMLKETGGMLGGETSGHLLCLDRTTTGDALISALQVLAIMKQTGRSLAELAAPMPKYPQVLENVRVATRIDPTKSPQIQEAVARAEGRLGRQRPDRAAAVGHRTGDPRDGRRQRREAGAGDRQGAGGVGGSAARRPRQRGRLSAACVDFAATAAKLPLRCFRADRR